MNIVRNKLKSVELCIKRLALQMAISVKTQLGKDNRLYVGDLTVVQVSPANPEHGSTFAAREDHFWIEDAKAGTDGQEVRLAFIEKAAWRALSNEIHNRMDKVHNKVREETMRLVDQQQAPRQALVLHEELDDFLTASFG